MKKKKKQIDEPLDLPETYHRMISTAIDEKGVYPHQMLVHDKDGKLGVFALDLNQPQQVMDVMLKTLLKEEPKELMYGLDRFAKPNQGTTLGDLIGGAYWNGEAWRTFIIEYQHEPRIVKPIDWSNEWWNESLKSEIMDFMATRFGQKAA